MDARGYVHRTPHVPLHCRPPHRCRTPPADHLPPPGRRAGKCCHGAGGANFLIFASRTWSRGHRRRRLQGGSGRPPVRSARRTLLGRVQLMARRWLRHCPELRRIRTPAQRPRRARLTVRKGRRGLRRRPELCRSRPPPLSDDHGGPAFLSVGSTGDSGTVHGTTVADSIPEFHGRSAHVSVGFGTAHDAGVAVYALKPMQQQKNHPVDSRRNSQRNEQEAELFLRMATFVGQTLTNNRIH